MSSIYHGRLVCDGDGNLLADEGDQKGYPVKYHEGSFVFVQPGEASHNETHESNVLPAISATVDASMTDDETLVNAYEGGENAHHFDQPNPDEPPHKDPDAVAAKVTGHTDAYKGGE